MCIRDSLYDELVAILKNIKTEHRKDKTTSDGSMIDNLMKELEDCLLYTSRCV